MKAQYFLALAITVTAILSGHRAEASNLCANALLPALSEQTLEAKFDDLAAMKLKLDESLANGSNTKSLTLKMLQTSYSKKLNELFTRTSMSSEDLSAILSKKIARLQGRQDIEIGKEHEVRQAYQDSNRMKPPTYSLDRSIPLDLVRGTPNIIGKLATDKFIFYKDSEKKLHIFDMSSEKGELFGPQESVLLAKVSKDGQRIAFIDSTWYLHIYDIESRYELHGVQLDIKPFIKRSDLKDFESMDFNPSETSVVLAGTSVTAFDVASGKSIGSQNASNIQSARFINDSEVVFANGHTLSKYNFATKQVTTQEFPGGNIFGFEVSSELHNITLVNFSQVYTFESNGLGLIHQGPAYQGAGSQTYVFKQVPSDVRGHVLTMSVNTGRLEIHEQETWTTVCDFNNYYSLKGIRYFSSAFSFDKSRLYVFSFDRMEGHLDIWKLN